MVKSSPGVHPKPRFGLILDSTVLGRIAHICGTAATPVITAITVESKIGLKKGFGLPAGKLLTLK